MRLKKIYIEISNACNLKCSFCPTTKRKIESMTLNQFSYILSSIKGYTKYIYLHVKGEPLFHPNFQEFLKVAKEQDFFVNITTNGTLIKKYSEFLANTAPPRQINFSLHSFDGEVQTIDSGEYLENIFKFCDLSLKTGKTYLSLRLWNYNSSEKEELKNLGNLKILQSIENHFKTEKSLSQKLIPGKGIKLKDNLYLNSDSEFRWPTLCDSIISETGSCYGLKDHIAILSNGDIVPCCLDGEGVIKLGNIFSDTLSSVLNSERTLSIIEGFRSKNAVEELCKKCQFKLKF